MIYADIDASTRGIIAIGVREEHVIYRLAVERLHHSEHEDDRRPQ